MQSKIKRKKVKGQQHKSEDELSPTSAPISPETPNGHHFSFDAVDQKQLAPLANQEDLEEDEKHETEATKEVAVVTVYVIVYLLL